MDGTPLFRNNFTIRAEVSLDFICVKNSICVDTEGDLAKTGNTVFWLILASIVYGASFMIAMCVEEFCRRKEKCLRLVSILLVHRLVGGIVCLALLSCAFVKENSAIKDYFESNSAWDIEHDSGYITCLFSIISMSLCIVFTIAEIVVFCLAKREEKNETKPLIGNTSFV